MKKYDPRRADQRPIEEKALGLIYAMDDSQAKRLHALLSAMTGNRSTRGQQRAAMFVGAVEGKPHVSN